MSFFGRGHCWHKNLESHIVPLGREKETKGEKPTLWCALLITQLRVKRKRKAQCLEKTFPSSIIFLSPATRSLLRLWSYLKITYPCITDRPGPSHTTTAALDVIPIHHHNRFHSPACPWAGRTSPDDWLVLILHDKWGADGSGIMPATHSDKRERAQNSPMWKAIQLTIGIHWWSERSQLLSAGWRDIQRLRQKYVTEANAKRDGFSRSGKLKTVLSPFSHRSYES